MKSETRGMMPGNADPKLNNEHPGMKTAVIAALALWLGLVVFLGTQGAFIGSPDLPPLRIFLGLAMPLAVFFTAYSKWGAFRAFILGADLRLVVAIQAWRWAGVGFLTLYAKGALPGLFAFPAGLGDMAVGFTAPWMVLNLVRQPSFATSRRFVIWNIMGVFDFVVAVSVATLCSGAFHGMSGFIGNITTSSMAQLPLVLIPAFMVPLFTMLHCTALFQARRLRAEAA
ncbi:MAG TPA: hypothetical protein VG347_04590 [Verrucomicrobiae bacterium]|nr:hypothetical protein [Verrucomicrobiae bacterium]